MAMMRTNLFKGVKIGFIGLLVVTIHYNNSLLFSSLSPRQPSCTPWPCPASASTWRGPSCWSSPWSLRRRTGSTSWSLWPHRSSLSVRIKTSSEKGKQNFSTAFPFYLGSIKENDISVLAGTRSHWKVKFSLTSWWLSVTKLTWRVSMITFTRH